MTREEISNEIKDYCDKMLRLKLDLDRLSNDVLSDSNAPYKDNKVRVRLSDKIEKASSLVNEAYEIFFDIKEIKLTMKAMQERVLEAIKLYEAKCSGKDVDYVITEVIEDESEGATLYLFESEKEGIKSAAFAYESGEVFLLTDWQGSRPEKLSEVGDYDWVTISGHDAINLNGYPRKFC